MARTTKRSTRSNQQRQLRRRDAAGHAVDLDHRPGLVRLHQERARVDHLICVDDRGIRALAGAGTIATLLPAAALGVFLLATLFFFDYFKVLRGDIGVYLSSLFSVVAIGFAVNRLANAVLSPRLPNFRLISISIAE